MVLKINQETFDDAVKENISEFGMTPAEAVQDAIKQFETQGVDLSNILENLMLSKPADSDILRSAVAELGSFVKAGAPVPADKFQGKLEVIQVECDKGLDYRIFAGKEGAYSVIIDVMLSHEDDMNTIKACLKAVVALMTKQPDLLDERGVRMIAVLLDKQNDVETGDLEMVQLLLKWIKECCIMHELNRQHLIEASILNCIKPLFNSNTVILRDVLLVLRALVLDDDVRVEFGRAHEHARIISNECLSDITRLLEKYKTEELVISDVMLTLSSLLVRNEYCKQVAEGKGVDMIKEAMVNLCDREKIARQSFKLLKVLAGNDEVKSAIIRKELAPIICSTLDKHKGSVQTVITGLGCVAALTLRSPDNSKALFEAGIPEVITDCMKQHPNDANIQKTASWAIRNMVSRSRYQNDKFMELGVEDILRANLKRFSDCEFDFKSALRDLDCRVSLKEEWTGKGGKLNTESKTK